MATKYVDIVVGARDQASRVFGKVGGGLSSLTSKITAVSRSWAGMAASVAGGAGLLATFNKVRNEMDGIAKTASRLGLTTEALIGLRHAAELSGVGANTVDMAMQRMTRRLAEAAKGSGEAVGALDELGLSAEVLANKSPDQALEIIAERMQAVESHSDKVRLAFKLFDSEGVALINMLEGGAAGLREARAEAERLGKTFGADAAQGVERMNDAMTRAQAAITSIGISAVSAIAPAIEKTATWISANKGLATAIGGTGVAAMGLAMALPGLTTALSAAGVAAKVAFANPLLTVGVTALAAFTAVAVRSIRTNESWTESAYKMARAAGMFRSPVQNLGNAMEEAGNISRDLKDAQEKVFQAQKKNDLDAMIEARREELRLMEDQINALSDQVRARDAIVARVKDEGAEEGSAEMAVFRQRASDPDWDRKQLREAIERFDTFKKTLDALEKRKAKEEAQAIAAEIQNALKPPKTDTGAGWGDFWANMRKAGTDTASQVGKALKQALVDQPAEYIKDTAARIFEETRTAEEKFEREVRQLQSLRAVGALDDDTFQRAMKQARERLGGDATGDRDSVRSSQQLPAAEEGRFLTGLQQAARERMANDPAIKAQQDTAVNTRQTAKNTQELNGLLKKLMQKMPLGQSIPAFAR